MDMPQSVDMTANTTRARRLEQLRTSSDRKAAAQASISLVRRKPSETAIDREDLDAGWALVLELLEVSY